MFAMVARSFPTATAIDFLREMELVGEAPVGRRLVDGIQVFPLDVLDQRELEECLGLVAPVSRTFTGTRARPALLCRAPAPFARDDAIAVTGLAHDESAG